jgi:hypothetical protein
MATKTFLIGATEICETVARDLADNGTLPEAPQGPIRAAVQTRLDAELAALQRPGTADETAQQIGRRLGSITALRWVLDLSGLARDAMDGA